MLVISAVAAFLISLLLLAISSAPMSHAANVLTSSHPEGDAASICPSSASAGATCALDSTAVDVLSRPPAMTHKPHGGSRPVAYEDSPLLVGNTKNPTHLVTLVHGLGDSANGWRQPAQMLAGALPHVLFVLPTAPQQPLTVAGGRPMNAWFDVIEGGQGMTAEQMAARRTDTEGVLASARYLAHLAGHIAHKHKIPTNKIIFGGFSQGAAVSIVAGLTAPYVPRAVMSLSGFFPAAKEAIAASQASGQLAALTAAKIPFRFFHGDNDQMLPLALARLSVGSLEGAGVGTVELSVYRGMGHSTSPDEIREVTRWLKEVTA